MTEQVEAVSVAHLITLTQNFQRENYRFKSIFTKRIKDVEESFGTTNIKILAYENLYYVFIKDGRV